MSIIRPNSRGSSGLGAPPATSSIRPASGKRAPGTARLRTGIAASGPGMQAAQGVALNASINVSDRPMTGQGVMGMRTQAQGPGRLVQDSPYFIGVLRKKITDILNETQKLRSEMDQHEKDNTQAPLLEKRFEKLLKDKESLEGQLEDYNLALDKASLHSSTC